MKLKTIPNWLSAVLIGAMYFVILFTVGIVTSDEIQSHIFIGNCAGGVVMFIWSWFILSLKDAGERCQKEK